jgi:1,4-dihydroxy-2-naphthoate octaprenyltransferase
MEKATLRAWIQASRPPFFIATLAPLLMGWILAKNNGWHTGRFFIVVLGSLIVHLVTNLANDYFEYFEGTDAGEAIGGSRVLQEGKISPKKLIKAIIFLYGMAFVVAFYLMFSLNLFAIFPLVLFAFFSSLFYVAPPVRYGYHGLGELFVGINMGPVMVVGTHWVMAGHYNWKSFCVSIPVGLMVASILYYQSLPDMRTDLETGKYTLAVKLGRKGAFWGLIIFWVVIYLTVLILIFVNILSWLSILSLFTIPVFVKMVLIVKKTENWILLDEHGKYVRILYFLSSIAIIIGLF